ncbi:uncharacterized protein VP01_856g5 [Puccinia sorghi]|uniref:Alpha-type protein kinase domain-containing protein n=1 Tax=Puccinia sorghi TaxID=27349 RepID=A0A0L6U934_9BASI|nr:uncharacterized protein VP01_856g5 [Puccinia sorghi]
MYPDRMGIRRFGIKSNRNFSCWADGNNTEYSIAHFITLHKCNDICKVLSIIPPKQIYDNGVDEIMSISNARKLTGIHPKWNPIQVERVPPGDHFWHLQSAIAEGFP